MEGYYADAFTFVLYLGLYLHMRRRGVLSSGNKNTHTSYHVIVFILVCAFHAQATSNSYFSFTSHH